MLGPGRQGVAGSGCKFIRTQADLRISNWEITTPDDNSQCKTYIQGVNHMLFGIKETHMSSKSTAHARNYKLST